MQNTQNAITAVQIYLRDLRLTATEREQVSGLVGNIINAIQSDIAEIQKTEAAKNGGKATAPKIVPKRGDPDKDIATETEDRAFAEIERR